MQNHTNARDKMFKNSTIVDMVVEFVACYIHDGGFRGQYDSALAQLPLNCLLPAHIYCHSDRSCPLASTYRIGLLKRELVLSYSVKGNVM